MSVRDIPAVVLLGDELAGAAFRLAGVDVREPPHGAVEATFAQALREAALVLLTPQLAAALPADVLRDACRRESPLVAVLPDLVKPRPDEALTRRIRGVLGIES